MNFGDVNGNGSNKRVKSLRICVCVRHSLVLPNYYAHLLNNLHCTLQYWILEESLPFLNHKALGV
jgi:hypothetical protein